MNYSGSKYKVVLTDPKWEDIKLEEEQLRDIADLFRYKCRSEEELIMNCADADALLVTYAPVTKKVIKSLKKCKVISVYAIGLDMVDLRAATESGILVTNVPGYCIEEVCDHAMALLLAMARKIVFYHNDIVQNKQWNYLNARPVYRLRGKLLGLIGYGKISRALAERAKSFGMRVMIFDPYVSNDECKNSNVIKANLDDIFRQSDYISIHTPLTSETKGLINKQYFKIMKSHAVIINASRLSSRKSVTSNGGKSSIERR